MIPDADLTVEQVAKFVGCHRNTVSGKRKIHTTLA